MATSVFEMNHSLKRPSLHSSHPLYSSPSIHACMFSKVVPELSKLANLELQVAFNKDSSNTGPRSDEWYNLTPYTICHIQIHVYFISLNACSKPSDFNICDQVCNPPSMHISEIGSRLRRSWMPTDRSLMHSSLYMARTPWHTLPVPCHSCSEASKSLLFSPVLKCPLPLPDPMRDPICWVSSTMERHWCTNLSSCYNMSGSLIGPHCIPSLVYAYFRFSSMCDGIVLPTASKSSGGYSLLR